MQLHLRQLFSGLELKVFHNERSGLRRRIVCGVKCNRYECDEQDRECTGELHGNLLKTGKLKSWKETRKGDSKFAIVGEWQKASLLLLIRYTNIFIFSP